MSQPTPPVIDYENSGYQDKFWDQGQRAYEDRVEAIALKRLLPPAGGRRLLELGAGAGRNTPRYQNYREIVLVDYSLTQLQEAQARLGTSPRYRYMAADIYHLPFGAGSFDAATMIRTLHHMADAPLALQQVHAVLCGGADFILEIANKRNLKSMLRYLLGQQKWSPFTLEPVEFVKLNFDFHPRAVRGWLAALGFDIQRQLSVSHFRVGVLKKLVPLQLLVGLDALLQPTGALFQFTPSVFLRARKKQPEPALTEQLILRCPACGQQPLADTPPAITCSNCRRVYPVRNGIYDFRLNAN